MNFYYGLTYLGTLDSGINVALFLLILFCQEMTETTWFNKICFVIVYFSKIQADFLAFWHSFHEAVETMFSKGELNKPNPVPAAGATLQSLLFPLPVFKTDAETET